MGVALGEKSGTPKTQGSLTYSSTRSMAIVLADGKGGMQSETERSANARWAPVSSWPGFYGLARLMVFQARVATRVTGSWLSLVAAFLPGLGERCSRTESADRATSA